MLQSITKKHANNTMKIKSQAGLELMAMIAVLLIFTISINAIFFNLNLGTLKNSQRETLISRCLDINTLISKILAQQSLIAAINIDYNMTFNSTAKLITIFSDNDFYTCGLISSRVKNLNGTSEFNVTIGARTIKNNGKEVIII